MKVFLDTNVLVAACVADHEHHARALPLVQEVHQGEAEGFVSAHSLLETHAILTRLPPVPRIPPTQASAKTSPRTSPRDQPYRPTQNLRPRRTPASRRA